MDYQQTSPLGYMVLAILAGVYLGFGITLIFSVGAPFAAEGSAAVKLVMGASFGIALTLIIFAGAELFTGNNMICTIGALGGRASHAADLLTGCARTGGTNSTPGVGSPRPLPCRPTTARCWGRGGGWVPRGGMGRDFVTSRSAGVRSQTKVASSGRGR